MLLFVILLGIVLRCVVDLRHGLWEDEIIAATHAVQPFKDVLVDVLRNDIHPPLYFLQLHAWALVSHRDGWLIANSVFWSLVSLWSLWFTLRREGRPMLGLTAAAMMAVLPAGLWMAQELRPYAWLCVLLIWTAHYARRAFGGHHAHLDDVAVLFLGCLAIIWSHAIGFLAVLAVGVYAVGLLLRRRAPVRDVMLWLGCFALLGLASLPVLASNLLHDANLFDAFTPAGFLASLSSVVTVSPGGRGVFLFGLAVFLLATGCGLAMRRTRLMAACFLLLPMLVALALGLTLKPIFKANFFGTLLAPFLALVLAELALRLDVDRQRIGTTALLAALAGISIVIRSGGGTVTGFLDAARMIRAEARPGDVVMVPQLSMFWGMAWYLDGPDWGSPLAIAPLPSRPWQAVYRRLGPHLVERLRLMPTGDTVAAPGGLTLLVGSDGSAVLRAAAAPGIWLVTRARADLPSGYPSSRIGALHEVEQRHVFALLLTLYR